MIDLYKYITVYYIIMTRDSRSGFTLVEIMIVVAVIAIIASIASANFVRARTTASRNACITNLRQIDVAMEQWSFEKNVAAGTTPTTEQEDEVYSYIDGGKPACPSKGEYTIYAVGAKPQVRCSREDIGHALPE